MESTLEKIIASKKVKIEAKSQLGIYASAKKKAAEYVHKPLSLKEALQGSESGIIAEFKRRSPSQRDMIHPYASPAVIIPEYEKGGAAACSVLTDTVYFGGSLSDLAVARHSCNIPLLRRDFILDPRQLFEARLWGADAVQLIADTVSKAELKEIVEVAHEIGLEVVLDIHDEADIDKIVPEVDVIGVNNRNLADYKVDLTTAERLYPKLPTEILKISESGITTPEEVRKLREIGYRGFLIGTLFMERANPGVTLRHFINDVTA